MLARVISSFVPLLLNLGVSAAPRDLRQSPITKSILPPGPAIIDLSPRITGNSTIFISTSLNPDEVTNVYDSDGKVIYMAVPSSVATEKFLVIENVRSPFALKMVKADQLNCTASLDMHYYLDQPSREWSLPSETHQPGAFSAIYKASPKGGPAGEVQVTSTNNGMLAKISNDPSVPSALPKGSYYSIFISADSGHQPYVTEAEAVALLWLIVRAGTQCAQLH